MKTKISILTFLFFSITLSSFGQIDCNFSNVQKLEKDYLKSKKKTIKKYHGKGNLAYSIADCYRMNNDTTYLIWYYNAVVSLKKDYSKEKDKSKKPLLLLRIAFSYYYISDFKQAEIYFRKAIKSKIDNPLAFYYLCLSLVKQQKWKEAYDELSVYKTQCFVCDDTDELMKKCLSEMEKQK